MSSGRHLSSPLTPKIYSVANFNLVMCIVSRILKSKGLLRPKKMTFYGECAFNLIMWNV